MDVAPQPTENDGQQAPASRPHVEDEGDGIGMVAPSEKVLEETGVGSQESAEERLQTLDRFLEIKSAMDDTDPYAFQEATRQSRPHAFVVMPFGRKQGAHEEWIDFDQIYAHLIQPALVDAGFEPFRADEETTSGDILTDMFQELLLADLVVVDMSIDNANVFYELGVRHAFRKRGVVHIQSGCGTLPFDVFNVRTIRYHVDGNGVPDVAYLDRDRQSLTRVTRDTWASDADAVHSPIFNLLTGLLEPDRKTLRTPLATGFWREYSQWKERVAIAQRQKRIGDILLLTEEISNPLIREEAVGEAGYALREMGRNELALKQYQQGLAINAKNIEFRREEAFHLNRRGRVDEAIVKLERLLDEEPSDTLAISYLGRIYKDIWEEAWRHKGEDECRQAAFDAYHWLVKSIDTYIRGYRSDLNVFYPAINALTLASILVGLADAYDDADDRDVDIERIRRLLPDLRRMLWFALEPKVQEEKSGNWVRVFIAEWYVTGNAEESLPRQVTRAYRKALADSQTSSFYLRVSRQRLEVLYALDIRRASAEAGLAVLNKEYRRIEKKDVPPPVDQHLVTASTDEVAFLFAGHRLDMPGRQEARFPPMLENEVRRKINRVLDDLEADDNDHAFLSGIACGGDIVFIEAALERGLKIHVHMPCAEADYIEANVTPGGNPWVERFYQIRNHRNVNIYYQANRLRPAKAGVDPYERNIRWTLYSSLILGIDKVRLIALWDGQTDANQDKDGKLVSGMVSQMRHLGGMVEHLNIAKFHNGGDLELNHMSALLSIDERVAFLRGVKLFRDVGDNDLKHIAAVAVERQFTHQQLIAAQGDVGDMLYVIVQGDILAKVKDENGVEHELGQRKQGEYIGEMAIVGGETRMASMVAVGDVLTLCLDRDQFQEILERRPAASLAVIQQLREMAQTVTKTLAPLQGASDGGPMEGDRDDEPGAPSGVAMR